MKATATWFLAGASLALGLFVACLANANQVRGELGARFVRANADLEREVRDVQLAIEAARSELERRVLAGEPLPYEAQREALAAEQALAANQDWEALP